MEADTATAFAFSAPATNYLIVGTNNGNLCVFSINNNLVSDCVVTQNGDTKQITSIAVSSQGFIAVGGAGDTIYFYTLNDQNKLILAGQTKTAFEGNVKSLAFTPDGSTLLIGEWTAWKFCQNINC